MEEVRSAVSLIFCDAGLPGSLQLFAVLSRTNVRTWHANRWQRPIYCKYRRSARGNCWLSG